ncbi:MAG: leucine-rich repeat domain-containing protein [Candidatus Thorarchaeota archaeon]
MAVTLKLKRTDEAPKEVHISDTEHIILRDQDIEWIDISPLKSCKDLRELELHKNDFESIDLSPLSSCTQLEYLSLSTNRLTEIDLTPLASCTSLIELVIHRNSLRSIDLSPLSSCHNLQKLGLGQNALEKVDLTPLSSCKKLSELWLNKNQLESIDLTPLASCTKLKALYLAGNRLHTIDLTPLSNCQQLVILVIAFNRFTSIDLTPLRNTKNLQTLMLQHNEIKSLDLSPLYYCKSLELLYIEANHFREVDLTPLALFENLGWKTFSRNFEVCSNELRRINVLLKKENFWKLYFENEKYAKYDVPVTLSELEIISGIYHKVVDTEPLWKQVHLLHNALTLTGFGWCGIIDSDPQSLMQEILSSPKSKSLSEKLVALISEQIDRHGTTIGVDLGRMAEFSELATRVDDVHELRKQEMKTVEVGRDGLMFDLRSLLLTAQGNQVLTSLGLGVKCNEDGIDEIKDSISELGFELRMADDIPESQLTRFSPALAEYIWNRADYNSVLKRGTSRRLKRKTLKELGLIE